MLRAMKITDAMRKAVMKEMAAKGGKARAKNLTKDELSKIGKKGAKAMWAKRRSLPNG